MTITERDERGRVTKSVLSSERAKEIGKLGGAAKAGNSRDQLLKEAGYDNPDDAPEGKRLLAQQAAKGYVPAIKGFLAKEDMKDVSVAVIQPGERCPTCHQYVLVDMQIPDDEMESVIDGLDQRNFFEGKQMNSAREGFPYWMGETMYGIKWQNFKVVFIDKRSFADFEHKLATPYVINLDVDPKEEKPYDYPYIHSWVMAHVGEMLNDYVESIKKEPLIPAGVPLEFVPTVKQ